MKKTLIVWQLAGFVFTGITGVILHFLYDWTDSIFVATFSAVNESIWEHMKLLFFPLFVFALVQSRYFTKTYNSFWCVKLVGILAGVITIPLIYYSYTSILDKSVDWFNIAIFYIASVISYALEILLLKKDKKHCLSSNASIVILCIIAAAFVIFTFSVPQFELFKDPVTKNYGISVAAVFG